MRCHPLESMGLDEAMRVQFHVVDCIMQEFEGHEILTRGDLGVVRGLNKPVTTKKAEAVIARIFAQEAAIMVRGAGSAAIRFALHSVFSPGDVVLIHKAPVYNTTRTSMEMLGLRTVEADYNDLEEVKAVLSSHDGIRGALVQYTRQKIDDSYDMHDVVGTIRSTRDIPIVTDDNYAVMKVHDIGVQCGADLSCFSSFKLLGHEALDVLHGLVYAPVSLAIQAQVGQECVRRLKEGDVPHVKDAFLANAQSKVLLVEFDQDIAERVLEEAERLGAAPNPVGAESKYEFVPMFYRVSGTFRKADPTLEGRMIRINPMRSGADTIMRVLQESIRRATGVSGQDR